MPDFYDFSNDLTFITSRSDLIKKTKRMMMEKGVRSNL